MAGSDLSGLSDEELDRLIAEKQGRGQDLSRLSDEELDARIEAAQSRAPRLSPRFEAAIGEMEADRPGRLEAGLRGATYVTPLGSFVDEAQAAGAAGLYGVAKGVRSLLPGGVPDDAPSVSDTYARLREHFAGRDQQAFEDHKGAYRLGEAAGIVGQGAKVAGKIPALAATAVGGLHGALSGAGAAEPGHRLEGAAKGGALGATVAGVLAKAPDAARTAHRWASDAIPGLESAVGKQLARLTGAGGAQAANAVGGGQRLGELGLAGEAEGLLQPLRDSLPFTGEAMKRRVGTALDQSGATLASLRDRASAQGGVSITDVKDAILAATAKIRENPNVNSGVLGRIDDLIADAEAHAATNGGLVTANALQSLKGATKQIASQWVREGGDATLAQTARQGIYGAIENAAETSIKNDLGKAELEQYLAEKARYGTAKGLSKLLALAERRETNSSNGVGGLMGGVFSSTGATIGGYAGGPAGAGLGALGGPLASRALTSAGAGILKAKVGAAAMKGLERAMGDPTFGRVLQDAAQRGPQAVAATHWLLQQQSPDYRALTMDQDENPDDQP